MLVDVTFTPGELEAVALQGCTAVVVDVLRATTTIVAALESGAAGILAVKQVKEARLAAQETKCELPPLLAGERDSQLIPGFDLGNSPLEFTPLAVAGKPVILTTTNGTRTLQRTGDAAEVMTGCLRNAGSVARACCRSGRNVVIACAGTRDRFSIEDVFCAGVIARHLHELEDTVTLSEAATACLQVAEAGREDPEAVLRSGRHGQSLLDLGFAADLRYCAQIDLSQRVPVLANGWLI